MATLQIQTSPHLHLRRSHFASTSVKITVGSAYMLSHLDKSQCSSILEIGGTLQIIPHFYLHDGSDCSIYDEMQKPRKNPGRLNWCCPSTRLSCQ